MGVNMKVKDIMSKEIASVETEDSIERAAWLMKQYDVGSIPVCQNNEVIGIVTDRDLALRSTAEGQNTTQQKCGDIMTTNLIVGDPEMNVDEAAKVMSERQIRRLPIVENNSLVGIVSLGDISLEPTYQNKAEETLKNISRPF